MSAQLADLKPVKGQKLPDVVRRITTFFFEELIGGVIYGDMGSQ